MLRHEALDPKVAAGLLVEVLQDPLGLSSANHIHDWLFLLESQFPLWAYQAWAYAEFKTTSLPSSYPLQLIINSVVIDDGMTPRDWTKKPTRPEGAIFPVHEEAKDLTPLEYAIDRRRLRLADEGRYGPLKHRVSAEGETYEELPLAGGRSRFNLIYPLPVDVEEDWEDPNSIAGQERDLVGRLTNLVEQRDSAGTPETRQRADTQLQELVSTLGIARGRGNPGRGPRITEQALDALVDQGGVLVATCGDSFPIVFADPLPRPTRRAFEDLRVDYDETKKWTARLGLPCFSQHEIRVLLNLLRHPRRGPLDLTRCGPSGLTPRELAICILARRLGIPSSTLAGRVTGGGVRERLAQHDPFQEPS